jgi:nucleoside-diphosphate-sugar epimerase
VVSAGLSDSGDGEVVNAGLGQDIPIKDLARMVADPAHGGRGVEVRFVEHDHPQAEIPKLLCDNTKAAQVFSWRPEIGLAEGICRTREWIALNPEAL